MRADPGRLALAALAAIALLAVAAFAQQAATTTTTTPNTGGGGLITTTPLAPAPSLSTAPAPTGATLAPTAPPVSSLTTNGANGASAGNSAVSAGPPVTSAAGAVLRALDRVSGAVEDIPISKGETQRYGRLDITLGDCRYPTDNPASDAYAFLTITRANSGKVLFRGWMIASSPALDALDHPRYDVWVLRCQLPARPSSGG